MTTRPKCIVCGRALAKRADTLYFREPQPYRPAVPYAWGGDFPAQEAKPDGFREGNALYLDDRPRTRTEAQRHVNGQIISSRRQGDFLYSVNYWDGESYTDKFFCTNHCAERQGYASAHHGDRFTWKRKS